MRHYSTLYNCTLVALISAVCGVPALASAAPRGFAPSPPDSGSTAGLMSDAQLAHWLATTDAKLTFVGPRPYTDSLAPRNGPGGQNTTIVTYCTKKLVFNTCGGECTVYNGGATCIDAPDTECIAANKDVGFCDKRGCHGNCNDLDSCGTKLQDGFCFVPGTRSIVVSPL